MECWRSEKFILAAHLTLKNFSIESLFIFKVRDVILSQDIILLVGDLVVFYEFA